MTTSTHPTARQVAADYVAALTPGEFRTFLDESRRTTPQSSAHRQTERKANA